MPGWYYEKSDLINSPSIKDGLDVQTEKRYRREGARFIIDVGADLNLRYDTVATGCVYFHRFFMFHSFKEFNKHVTALGCLFLAGKVEETPKKCKDLLRVARQRLTDEQFVCFGEDPKEDVMIVERVLLQTIKFDLQVEHPYQFLIKYAKSLKVTKDKSGMEHLVQMAWTFINDSLCTTICLEYEPEIVAIALMYLASRLGKFQINDWTGRKNAEHEKWWDQFVEDLTLELLEDICHQVLDLYSTPQNADRTSGSKPSSSGALSGGGGGGGGTAAKVSPTMSNALNQISGRPQEPPKIQQNLSTVIVTPAVAAVPVGQHQPPPPPMSALPPATVVPQVYAASGGGPYAYPVAVVPPAPQGQIIPPRSAPAVGGLAAPAYSYPPPPTLAAPPPGQYAYYAQPPPPPQHAYATPQAYNVPPPGRPIPPDYMVQQRQIAAAVPQQPPPPPPPPQLYSQRVMMMRPPSRPPPNSRY